MAKKDNRLQWTILIVLLLVLSGVIAWNLFQFSSDDSRHRIPVIDEVLRRQRN